MKNDRIGEEKLSSWNTGGAVWPCGGSMVLGGRTYTYNISEFSNRHDAYISEASVSESKFKPAWNIGCNAHLDARKTVENPWKEANNDAGSNSIYREDHYKLHSLWFLPVWHSKLTTSSFAVSLALWRWRWMRTQVRRRRRRWGCFVLSHILRNNYLKSGKRWYALDTYWKESNNSFRKSYVMGQEQWDFLLYPRFQ